MNSVTPECKRIVATPPHRASPLMVLLGLATLALLAILAVACQSAGKAGTSPEVTGQPRLQVDQSEIDFGRVDVGKTVRASFKLRNVGDQPLRLQDEPEVEVAKGC